MIIGLCGLARSGKDSFYNIAKDLKFNSKPCLRFAFADYLKTELDNFLIKQFQISSFTENSREKEIIRPTLVGYGMSKRKISNGRYWIDKLSLDILDKKEKYNCFITDVRFTNEVEQIKKWGGFCIHIERTGNPPANDEEKNEDPFLKSKSNHIFKWGDLFKERREELESKIFNILQKYE
tara:strand:+ start:1023 stop:1562 length:540 start_codon:yes stop_codon:yes gene_type:complete